MSHVFTAEVVSDNAVEGSSGHKSRAGNVFSSCYLWPSLKGKQMVLLSELFCSCFKWLIQIKHGILFLVKAAAALSELGCFYQLHSLPWTEWLEKITLMSLSPSHKGPKRLVFVCRSPGLYCMLPLLRLYGGCILSIMTFILLPPAFNLVQALTFPLKTMAISRIEWTLRDSKTGMEVKASKERRCNVWEEATWLLSAWLATLFC